MNQREMPRDSRHRDKRSTSYSSESSYDRKKSKSRYRRRSRSRNKSESSRTSRRRRSTSRSKYKRRSYSRSISRDRYESKTLRRSSRSKSKRSKYSRDRSRSLSSSCSRSKHSKSSKKHRRRSHSSSRSDSFDIEKSYKSKCFINVDDTETQVEKAIKAAEAAGVTLTKIPTYEYKEVEVREDMPTIQDRNVLDDINSDTFVQKTFSSSKSKKSHNIVIDLNAETVKVPVSEAKPQNDDSIINFANIPCEAELKEMWVKKLYQFRKKMLRGEIQ